MEIPGLFLVSVSLFRTLGDILIHVLHMYIIYYSGSVWMSIVTFLISRLTFMVEFWFTSPRVFFLLRILYMATTSYNLCTRQR